MEFEKKLLTLEDVDNLDLKKIKNLYDEYINPYQTKILSNFSFGSDTFVKAEGMHLFTSEGKKILDFTGGLGVLNHGHNHPRILNVRKKYAEKSKMEVHKLLFSQYQAGLSHNLSNVLGGDLKKTFLCNSGAEAVEAAIKLASRFNKDKKYILSSSKSYHGKLIGSGSISGSYQNKNYFPKMENVDFYEFGNLSSLEKKLENLHSDGGVYAVIIEPFSASLVESCSEEFIQGLVKLKKKYNFVIICDEVYCAWYKCGHFFYFKKFKNFEPDIIVLSKALGGGKSSISATVSKSNIYNSVYGSIERANLHTTTYNGFGEECATAIEAINILVEEKFDIKVKNLEKTVLKNLENILSSNKDNIKKFQGTGALWGVEFKSFISGIENILEKIPSKYVEEKSFLIPKLVAASISSELYLKYNILTFISESKNSNFLYVAPSIIAKEEDINYFFESLNKVINSGLNLNLVNYLIKSLFNLIK